ncbi:MAG: hypothetical protein MI757_01745 [Pirellulales bacterium]|nr:hypothetical protein [Pirellulales bacterium]
MSDMLAKALIMGFLGGALVGVMGFFVGVLADEKTIAQTFGGWGTVIGGAAGLIAGAIATKAQDQQ